MTQTVERTDIDAATLLLKERDVEAYSPKGHTGTSNRRLVGPEQGATHMEIVVGTLMPGGEASPHRHPGIDQFCWVLDGRARIEMLGVSREIGPGEAVFFPADVRHAVTPLGETDLRLLIAYSPPYGEGPRIDG